MACAPGRCTESGHSSVTVLLGEYGSVSDHVSVLTGLAAVWEYTYADADVADPRWLVAVALHFAEGVLVIEAEPDTDPQLPSRQH